MAKLRIIVVNTIINAEDESDASLRAQAERGSALRIGLLQAGYDIVASLPADIYLPDRIAQMQPDMIIIDAESDARDVLEHIVIATRDERRPIVMFTESDDTGSIDMPSALHPQTILATKYAREPITDPFGFPLRLRTALKLGFKQPKWITAMEVTNDYPGGYWEDMGFNWFSGI